MILYLIRSGACLLSLLAIYHLLLEKEKMLRFNRAWLLFSLLFSFIIPFLPLPWNPFTTSKIQDIPQFSWVTSIQSPGDKPFASNTTNATIPIINWITIIYGSITAVLLLRFFRNLYQVLHRVSSHPQVRLEGARLILLSENYIPHTFGNAIFINEKAYREGNIDKEILAHEYAHVRQFHSVDILLVEVLHTLFWFNPIFILFRRAIQLNHEFLADEAVIKTYGNPRQYQQLLFQLITLVNPSKLSSPSNYNFTKKRLIMIHQSTPRNGWIKKLLAIPLFLAAIITFSTATHAQKADTPTIPSRMILGTERLGANPYVLIDDKPYPSDILTRISPSCVAAISIIGDRKFAQKKYGPVAADGEISITLTKQGLSYATTEERENIAIERSAKNGFYYRLRLRNNDGTPFDRLVVNCGAGNASTDQKPDCKVAFVADDKLYTESQLDELQARLHAMKLGISGVGQLPKPIPGLDLSGYDAVFFFYSKTPPATPASR